MYVVWITYNLIISLPMSLLKYTAREYHDLVLSKWLYPNFDKENSQYHTFIPMAYTVSI